MSAQHKREIAEQRQQAWGVIQNEAPDVAEFLREVTNTFGRPEAVSIEIDDRNLIDTYPKGRIHWIVPSLD